MAKTLVPRYTNVSNPAALGIEVVAPMFPEDEEYDCRYQIVMINGHPYFASFRGDGWHEGDGWNSPARIVNPERFGKLPTNYRELLAYAQAFQSAGS